jgi:hypothetical protein
LGAHLSIQTDAFIYGHEPVATKRQLRGGLGGRRQARLLRSVGRGFEEPLKKTAL